MAVLKQILELEKYISKLDVPRMDKHGLAEENAESIKMITEFLYLKKEKEKSEKYKPFILLLIVAVLCILIWLMGR